MLNCLKKNNNYEIYFDGPKWRPCFICQLYLFVLHFHLSFYIGLPVSIQMNKVYLIIEVFQNTLVHLQVFTYWLIEYE